MSSMDGPSPPCLSPPSVVEFRPRYVLNNSVCFSLTQCVATSAHLFPAFSGHHYHCVSSLSPHCLFPILSTCLLFLFAPSSFQAHQPRLLLIVPSSIVSVSSALYARVRARISYSMFFSSYPCVSDLTCPFSPSTASTTRLPFPASQASHWLLASVLGLTHLANAGSHVSGHASGEPH